jgi:uncharacterized SAM-binding protein YcdF (DUF218 family)
MYFVASKVAWILLQPSSLLIWGTLIGMALLRTPLAKFGGRLVLIAGSFLAVCALTPLCVVLIRPLEDRFPAHSFDEIQNPKGIIALGGALNASLTRARGPIALGPAGARLTEALALAHYFPKARLVFSGGSADLLGNGIPEGDVAEEFISELGLPMDRVIIERKSRNTFENAQFTFDLVEPQPGDVWILVTSAYHMPRAVGSFERAGFKIAAYPVDYFTFGDQRDYWAYTFAPLKSLPMIDTAVKEWVALTIYWIFGKTTDFLPRAEMAPRGGTVLGGG